MSEEMHLSLPVGETLVDGSDVYEIIATQSGQAFLGQGGFGITYLAQDTKLGRKVAIKEFFPSSIAGRGQTHTVAALNLELFDKLKAYFLEEARMLASFDSPQIVKVLAYFEANNTAYMVMPYLEGDKLSERYKSKPYSEAEAIALMEQINQGVQILHNADIIHRDIKPDNIIYDKSSNTPILIDFGSARATDDPEVDERTRSTIGAYSPYFSPPELSDPSKTKTPATDIYAIAATIYRTMFQSGPPISTSRYLEDGENLPELAQAETGGQITPEFAEILRKSLELKPSNRYQNLDELNADLQNISQSQKRNSVYGETLVKPVTEPNPTRSSGNNRAFFAKMAGAFVVVALLATAIVLGLGLGQNPSSPIVADAPIVEDAPIIAAPLIEGDEPDVSDNNPTQTSALDDALAEAMAAIDVDESLIQSCDASAMHQVLEQDNPFNLPYIDKNQLNFAEVETQCNAVLAQDPQNQRARFLIARAYTNMGKEAEALRIFQSLDSEGYLPAHVVVGSYENGQIQGATINFASAAQRFQTGCEGNISIACQWAGELYENENFTNADKDRAVAYYEQSCARPIDGFACRKAGHIYADLSYANHNDETALSYFEKGCSLGDSNACANIGYAHLAYDILNPDMNIALDRLSVGCENGESWACFHTGEIYATGKLGDVRLEASEKWYQLSCDQGEAKGCRELGHLYANGNFSHKDNATALRFFEKGCELGDENSCANIGWGYENNLGVSVETAIERFGHGCQNGQPWACERIGDIYEKGEHNLAQTPDYYQAANWYELGCDASESQSCGKLGVLYETAKLGAKDVQNAQYFFQKGCDLQNGWPCSRLGWLYETEGQIRDYQQAWSYYDKGCSLDYGWGCGHAGDLFDGIYAPEFTKDLTKATHYYEKGCTLSDSWSCGAMARYHRDNLIANANAADAQTYARLACELGMDEWCNAASAQVQNNPQIELALVMQDVYSFMDPLAFDYKDDTLMLAGYEGKDGTRLETISFSGRRSYIGMNSGLTAGALGYGGDIFAGGQEGGKLFKFNQYSGSSALNTQVLNTGWINSIQYILPYILVTHSDDPMAYEIYDENLNYQYYYRSFYNSDLSYIERFYEDNQYIAFINESYQYLILDKYNAFREYTGEILDISSAAKQTIQFVQNTQLRPFFDISLQYNLSGAYAIGAYTKDANTACLFFSGIANTAEQCFSLEHAFVKINREGTHLIVAQSTSDTAYIYNIYKIDIKNG